MAPAHSRRASEGWLQHILDELVQGPAVDRVRDFSSSKRSTLEHSAVVRHNRMRKLNVAFLSGK